MRALWLLVVVTLGLAQAGCGKPTYEVSGNVRFDGEPVADGDLLFVPEDGVQGPDAGKIVAGRYRLLTRPGRKRVQITAQREVSGSKGTMVMGNTKKGGPLRANFVPEKYNAKTELTVDVTGDATFDFPLKSGKSEAKGVPVP